MAEPEDPNVVHLSLIKGEMNTAEAPRLPEPDGDFPPAADGGGAGRSPKPDPSLPKGCPVTPLGIEGDYFYYLDASKQLRTLVPREHSRPGLQSLFAGQTDYLKEAWPKTSKDGQVVSWRPERASEVLMDAAAGGGIWNPVERVRGPGCWRGDAGELIVHCGDAVFVHGSGSTVRFKPDKHERYVYPAGKTLPHPARGRPGPDGARELLELLKTWAWRGDIDAVLLLGWIAAGMLGGALRWRPAVWVTGGAGTGKSTLRDHVLMPVCGETGLVSTADATPAGIWQSVQWSTLPVAIDEIEAEADDRQVQAVIALARAAASGGLILRGGADHKRHQFQARSAFFFSSILVPPLTPQDRSRIAILDLGSLTGRARPSFERAQLERIGREMRRRLVMAWPRFDATLERYRETLMVEEDGRRLDARGADVYGTMLACAEVLLFDEREELDGDAWNWCDDVRRLVFAGERLQDEDHFLAFLLSSVVDGTKAGMRHTIAEWIHRAAGRDPDYTAHKAANRILGTYGLTVLDEYAPSPGGEPMRLGDDAREGGRPTKWLAIANQHRGLAQLLAGTHWGSRAGSQAVWQQVARRLAESLGGIKMSRAQWIGGTTTRATLLPLDQAVPFDAHASITLKDSEHTVDG